MIPPLPERDLAKLLIPVDATILEAFRVIEEGAEGIGFVVDAERRVIGSLTDGDLRRAILRGSSLDARALPDSMRRDFSFVTVGQGRAEVLDIMRARQIEQLPILDGNRWLVGLHTMRQLISSAERPNQVVILAGGRGTRLHPITETVPKPMVTVAGRPILERLILHLMSCGLRRFTLSVNYLANVIEEYFGDGSRFGCEIRYLREPRPLGTGGPLSLLDPPAIPLLVLNGDLVTQADVGRMLDFHAAGGFAATFGLRPHTLDIPYGVAEVEGDRLVALREKPTQRMLINAGIYVLSREAITMVPPCEEYPITSLFETLLAHGRPVGAHVLHDEWLDVGRHEELRRARGSV